MWPIFSSKPWWADLFLVYVADFFVTPWWGDLFLICVADVFRQTLMEWSVLVHVADFFRIPCWTALFFYLRGRFFPHTLLDWPFFLSTWSFFCLQTLMEWPIFRLYGWFFLKPSWGDLFQNTDCHNQSLELTILIESKAWIHNNDFSRRGWFFLQTFMEWPFFSLRGRFFPPNLDGGTFF